MKITIEGINYNLPASLMDITLDDRIQFDAQHGKQLKEQLKKISDMKDGPERELEFTLYHCEMACKTLSFFGKIPIDVLENTKMEEVLSVYHHIMKGMSEDTDFTNKDFELAHEFNWESDTWEIAPPELKHDSALTFGELLDAKQAVKDLWELEQQKWDALLSLCCVYFRKKSERYDKELAKEGGERYELLKTLPFKYALHVGFFLSATMSSWLKTYHSSNQTMEETADLN